MSVQMARMPTRWLGNVVIFCKGEPMVKNLLVTASVIVMLESGSAKADLVVNGGFETGDFTGWTLNGHNTLNFVSSENPHSGTYSAQAGDNALAFLS